MLTMAIDLNVWSGLLNKIVSIYRNLQFVDPIPRTCMAGKVMGQGLFALFKSLDFDISVICVIYTLFHNL